jgi:ABC-type transporter Mla MlaB component
MLRITVEKNGSFCRLKLAGRLWGPWVPEMEKAWRTALSSAAKQIEIDMKEVTAVDDDGRELLVSMHQAGARLVVQGVEMTALVKEITGTRPPAA